MRQRTVIVLLAGAGLIGCLGASINAQPVGRRQAAGANATPAGDAPQGGLRARLRRAAAERLRPHLIDRFDTNADGVIDSDELPALRAWIDERREKFQSVILERCDTDGDGELSDAEKDAAWTAPAHRLAERHESAVAQADANGDGELDAAEIQAAAAAFREGLTTLAPGLAEFAEFAESADAAGASDKPIGEFHQKVLERFDHDHSGGLNVEERAELRDAVVARLHEGARKLQARRAVGGGRILNDAQLLDFINGRPIAD